MHSATAQHGFSLIELMITIAILGLMTLVGANLNSGWIQDANINKATGVINESMTRAQSLALRNPRLNRHNAPSGALCLDTTSTPFEARVVEVTPPRQPVTSALPPQLWSGQTPLKARLMCKITRRILPVCVIARGG